MGFLEPSVGPAGLLAIPDTLSSATPNLKSSIGDRLSAMSFAWQSATRTGEALISEWCPSTISGRMLSPASPEWLSPNTLALASFTQLAWQIYFQVMISSESPAPG